MYCFSDSAINEAGCMFLNPKIEFLSFAIPVHEGKNLLKRVFYPNKFLGFPRRKKG